MAAAPAPIIRETAIGGALSDASLTELIEAFRLGSQISRSVPDHDVFNQRLTEQVMAHLNSHDRRALDLIQNEGSRGLIAARSGASELARDHFNRGGRLLATLPAKSKARLCAESFFSAQRAYFVYTQRQYRDAIALIEQAFSNDMLLETQHGLDILRMHRTQLLNNLMRIEARRENWCEALSLGCALLRYLEDPDDPAIRALSPPWNQGWSAGLEGIPPDLVCAMHAQVAREEVQVFHRAQHSGTRAKDIFGAFDSVTSGQSATQIDRWTDFQIVRSDPDRYFSAASLILRHGSVPSEPLWRSVANEVTRMLRPGLCIQATTQR